MWHELDLQVFLLNSFTYAEGMDNPSNPLFGIAAPMVSEY
jgi:hypothetical protein